MYNNNIMIIVLLLTSALAISSRICDYGTEQAKRVQSGPLVVQEL